MPLGTAANYSVGIQVLPQAWFVRRRLLNLKPRKKLAAAATSLAGAVVM